MQYIFVESTSQVFVVAYMQGKETSSARCVASVAWVSITSMKVFRGEQYRSEEEERGNHSSTREASEKATRQ